MLTERTDLRNIAIIAHVDHGKTTLVDGLLKQARVFRANQVVAERIMDSELGAADEQADFPAIYTNALTGQAGLTPDLGPDLQPLFDCILRHIPAPRVDPEAPLQMLVTTLGYDNYRGVTAVGRIFAGRMALGQPVARLTREGGVLPERVRYLQVHQGLETVDVAGAEAGEIVALAGLEGIAIGDTLADPEHPVALPTIRVEEPTVRMTFGVNTSPFSGREGRWSTSRKLRERLYDELRRNVALRVAETDTADTFIVSGRGELHLAILIETMRREGYEFQVLRPEVIYQQGPGGATLEPYEDVYTETSAAAVGTVIAMLGSRRGQMLNMVDTQDGAVRLTYRAPTRGLLGFRQQFLTATRGMGTLHTLFHGYGPLAGPVPMRNTGSLVAWEAGVTSTYALRNAEQRGVLFVGPGVQVYEGMVVGEQQRPNDLAVNVCKTRHLTSIHTESKEIVMRLNPPRQMSLDDAIEYLADDELLEVTPLNYRIRKRILDTHERGRQNKRAKEALEA